MDGTHITKDPADTVVDGVLSGLASYLGVQPIVLRLCYLGLAVLNPGMAVIVYVALMVIVPDGPPKPGAPTAPIPDEAAAAADDDGALEDAADASEATDAAPGERPGLPLIIGAGLVGLGAFLFVERWLPLPDFSEHAWALAILAIGVWILMRSRRDA